MLRKYYENMKAGLELQYEKKPRAATKLLIELASAVITAYEENTPVIWTSWYSFPMELLAAFDVTSFDFEVASNSLPLLEPDTAVDVMSSAEEEGYSADICSFHRLSVGCQMLGHMPRADLLLATSFFCDGTARINKVIASYHGKEAITLDVPNRIDHDSIAYVVQQLKTIAGKIEVITGKKLDIDRLRECIRLSNRARLAYSRTAELQKLKPATWNGITAVVLSQAQDLLNGKLAQERIYQAMLDECLNKMAGGKTLEENYRVMWLAWFPQQPTVVNEIFRKKGVNVVMGERTYAFWEEKDEQNPWEAMALWCLKYPYTGHIEQRLAGIQKLIDEYQIDGVIHFSTDACRHTCAGQRIIGDRLQKRGLPFLVLDGDMSDKRKYSEERTRLLLESFIEVMASRK